MASIQKKGDGGTASSFFSKNAAPSRVGKVSKAEAEAKAAQVDDLLMLLEQGLLTLPRGMDIVDVRPARRQAAQPPVQKTVQKSTSLGGAPGPLPRHACRLA